MGYFLFFEDGEAVRFYFSAYRNLFFQSLRKGDYNPEFIGVMQELPYCSCPLYTQRGFVIAFFYPRTGVGKKKHFIPFNQSVEVTGTVLCAFPVREYNQMSALASALGENKPAC